MSWSLEQLVILSPAGSVAVCTTSLHVVCQHDGAHIKMTLQSQRNTLEYKINTLTIVETTCHQMMSVRPHQVSQSCV